MILSDRLRDLRAQRNLSQSDIEERTGLLRCYVSRVENGHTVPAVATLEKFARALEVPLYQFFFDGDESPKLSKLPKRLISEEIVWGSNGKDKRMVDRFRVFFGRMKESDRQLLLSMAQRMTKAER